MSDLTFVIPVGLYHADIAQRAIDAVKAQTIPCEIVVVHDPDGRGAGWARNRGLASVHTKYVVFLDADDTIDPRFAELCLGVLDSYAQTHDDPRYVYTDWLGVGNVAHQAVAPKDAWVWGQQEIHLVTTVIPTHYARLVGGFDETLQGAEDVDFYIRLRLAGLCGLHINAPLVHYREGGQRSITARATGEETKALHYMTTRYGGYNLMGCCGDSTPGPLMPDGEPNEGDILVQAQWHGNMQRRGLVTGTIYARTSYPKYLYVNEADANQSPNLFKRVNAPLQASNGIVLQPQYKPMGQWQDTVNALFGGGQEAVSQPIEYRPHQATRKKADVVKKAQEWTKIEGSLE